MKPDFSPKARRGMTPEDVNRIYAATPYDGRAWGIEGKHGIRVRLFDRYDHRLAEAEARTGMEAFDAALAKVA